MNDESRPNSSHDTLPLRVRREIALARESQAEWSQRSVGDRLAFVRKLRRLLAERAQTLAEAVTLPNRGSIADSLAAEVLPLVEACRYLSRIAPGALAPRKYGRRGCPAWLAGLELTVLRDPHGLVLLVGPSNYPLFLPGVQTLQALVAGNAVLVKPGAGASNVAALFATLCYEAGLDRRLLRVLPEPVEIVYSAVDEGIDKVVFTGSAAAGREVLSALADRLIPATMELSGCDAVFVQEDADLDCVVKAIVFGLRFNGSATCIAPRRVFVHSSLARELEERLVAALAPLPPVVVSSERASEARTLVAQALSRGARLVSGDTNPSALMTPIVVANASPDMELLKSDIFAPVLALVSVASDDEALDLANRCPYALGATIFGRSKRAEELAARVRAGCVVINDMIAPAADPRFPFGGRGRSGFGVTRGLEGLLEMTVPKAISHRRSGLPPHLDGVASENAGLLHDLLTAVHGGAISARLKAAWRMIRQGLSQRRKMT